MTGVHPSLADLAVPVTNLVPLPGNPRQGDVAAVARSYIAFGQRKPLVARRTGEHAGKPAGIVIAGNHQLLAARELGWSEVAVVWVDDDDLTAKAFALADNRTADLGAFDEEALADLLGEVAADEDLLFAASYTEDDLAELLARTATPGPGRTDPDAVPDPPADPVTQSGDLWLLGPHRVLCGDGTDPDDLGRLLDGEAPALLVTSPPYNQGLDRFTPSGMHREHDWVSKVGRLAYQDSLPEDDYQAGQAAALRQWFEVLADGASVFYNHKHRYRDKQVLSPLAWLPRPFRFRQEVIWRRPGSVTQNARMFLPCDERIYWMYKGTDFCFHDTTEIKTWSTVWDLAPVANMTHAAAFPVELPTRCIRACSDPNALVLDPYGGSGTTLLAAHGTGRVARLAELEPRFVDVICRRFQDHTGTKPVLAATGEPHDFTEE